MKTLIGKFGTANVMIDEIDSATETQINLFLNSEQFNYRNVVIMPDCHAGKGCVIGTTMEMIDRITPFLIGVDIGCGMLTYEYDTKEVDVKVLNEHILENIPLGFSVRDKAIPIEKEMTTFITHVSKIVGCDTDRALKSIGTLGGGNHFIEAGINNKGNVCVTIHTGSRNFGKCIADYFQKKASVQSTELNRNLNDVQTVELSGKTSKSEFDYLVKNTAEYNDYLEYLGLAQAYAKENRYWIMNTINQFIKTNILNKYECIHNYYDFKSNIIRKGATDASLGTTVIIPFNMRDGIIIGIGKGNPAFNYSAPHGAGRILSRGEAKRCLSLDKYVNDLKNNGIYSTTANENTLDEAPDAYKDSNLIRELVKDTITITDFIKPVLNVKAGCD